MSDKAASTRTSKKIRKTVVDKTGFEPDELLTSPVKPPELKNTRPGPRLEQIWLIVAGFALAVLGLALIGARANFLGIVITVVGVLAITIATLVRV